MCINIAFKQRETDRWTKKKRTKLVQVERSQASSRKLQFLFLFQVHFYFQIWVLWVPVPSVLIFLSVHCCFQFSYITLSINKSKAHSRIKTCHEHFNLAVKVENKGRSENGKVYIFTICFFGISMDEK